MFVIGCIRSVRNRYWYMPGSIRLLGDMKSTPASSSISSPRSFSSSSSHTTVPDGCWKTARVDDRVDFSDVDLIFGYGSLVWKPPCDAALIVDSFPCRIKKYQRRFWQKSVDHRGTPTRPGYVVTILDVEHPDYQATGEGSSTEEEVFGMAYKIRDMKKILKDLDFREKNGYTRTVTNIYKPSSERPEGRAVLYLAEPGSDPAYAGPKKDAVVASTIAQARGPSGPNIDYFRKLEQFCKEHGVCDEHIERISDLIVVSESGGSSKERDKDELAPSLV